MSDQTPAEIIAEAAMDPFRSFWSQHGSDSIDPMRPIAANEMVIQIGKQTIAALATSGKVIIDRTDYDQGRAAIYACELSEDPEFRAEAEALARRINAGEDFGSGLTVEEFKRKYLESDATNQD